MGKYLRRAILIPCKYDLLQKLHSALEANCYRIVIYKAKIRNNERKAFRKHFDFDKSSNIFLVVIMFLKSKTSILEQSIKKKKIQRLRISDNPYHCAGISVFFEKIDNIGIPSGFKKPKEEKKPRDVKLAELNNQSSYDISNFSIITQQIFNMLNFQI